MKTNLTKILLIAIATMFTHSIYGQFNTSPNINDRWAQTNDPIGTFNDIRRGGMGNFTNFGTAPSAAFHINENYLTDLIPTAINYYLPGEVFRTTGPSTNVNAWRMFTGAGNGTERFSITIPANSNDAVLQTQQPNSRLLFNTNGALNRMLLMDGGTTNADGRVAMGNNLLAGFIPRSRLHLHHDDVSNISLRFSNSSTGTGNGDGFIVGYRAISAITNRQFAEMNNFENTAMKFWTNNTQRMHINASVQSNINGYAVPVPGFVGIGGNTGNIWGDQNNVGTGPFSLLHLNDVFGNLSAEQRGYRPWMKTGISYTTNEDYAYVGYRSFTDDNTATGNRSQNRNEFNIAWSNNEITSTTGSDDMAFRFTNRVDGANGMPNVIDATNLNSAEDLDGRHIARFTALGNMGLGATFGEDHPVYVKPQSLLHMSKTDTSDTWLQVTNQTGTGQTAADGLRIGITTTGTAHIKQQENLPLIFYTQNIEDARVIPQPASTLPATNHGMVGIGNFSLTGPNTAAADVLNAKLDIDGDLRIRTVTQRDTLMQVLVIDSADKNRVHWRSVASLVGNVTADNGLSIDPANNVQLGNDVGLTTAQLINDREIPMNDNNIMFNDNANSTSSIGIGHPLGTSSTTAGKLEVTTDVKVIAGVFNTQVTSNSNVIGVFSNSINNGNGSAAGVRGLAQSTSGAGNATGVRGVSLGTTGSGFAVGVGGESFSSSNTNVGVDGLARNASVISIAGNFDITNSSSPQNIGIQTDLNNGTNASSLNYGVQILMNTTGNINYGVFSNVAGASANWAGWFNGNVFVSGTVGPSDANLKTNVVSINSAMDIINQLNPVSFDFDNSVKPRLNLQQGKQYGLIAQDVETILPEMVGTTVLPAEYDSLGNETDPSFEFKTLDYERFVPLLIAGIKEQQGNLDSKDSIIENLETRLAYLENCIRNANICAEGNRTMNTEPDNNINNRSVELVNTNSIILDQNLPNPFKENTVINYNIPTEVVEAKLLFYDLNGRIIKELIIEERGESKLTVYGTNLKTGVYTYSLIADGELIATKKMVKK